MNCYWDWDWKALFLKLVDSDPSALYNITYNRGWCWSNNPSNTSIGLIDQQNREKCHAQNQKKWHKFDSWPLNSEYWIACWKNICLNFELIGIFNLKYYCFCLDVYEKIPLKKNCSWDRKLILIFFVHLDHMFLFILSVYQALSGCSMLLLYLGVPCV